MKNKKISQLEILNGIRKNPVPPTKIIESKKIKLKRKRPNNKEVVILNDLC